jgi:hypothetical protein
MRTRGARLRFDNEFFMLLGLMQFVSSALQNLRKTTHFLAEFSTRCDVIETALLERRERGVALLLRADRLRRFHGWQWVNLPSGLTMLSTNAAIATIKARRKNMGWTALPIDSVHSIARELAAHCDYANHHGDRSLSPVLTTGGISRFCSAAAALLVAPAADARLLPRSHAACESLAAEKIVDLMARMIGLLKRVPYAEVAAAPYRGLSLLVRCRSRSEEDEH